MAATAEKIIRIDVVTSANAQRTIKALAADMQKVERSTASMQRSVSNGFGSLNGMLAKFGGFIGAFGLTAGIGAITRGVIEMASSYKILGDRLTQVIGSADSARVAVGNISDIALITGRNIDGVGKLYEKSTRAAMAYGLSVDSVKDITLGFSQALRLSGANTQEAYAALVQFGQALASGRLQGDELRSILENNSVFMYELAAAAGKTVSELRKLGSEGKLGPKELFEIMTKRGEDGLNMLQRIDKKASEIPLTFSQSATAVGSAMTKLIGETFFALNAVTDDKQGIFGPLIRGLDAVAERIENINRIAAAAGDGFWRRFLDFSAGFFGMERGGPGGLPSNLPGGSGTRNDPFSTQVENRVDMALKKYSEAVEKVNSLQSRLEGVDSGNPRANMIRNSLASQLREAGAEADELYGKYIGLRKLLSDIRYGERMQDPPEPIKVPDPEAERRLKSAQNALQSFLEEKQREVDTNKLLLAGQETEKGQAKDLIELRTKLKDAGVAEASALAERGRALLELVKVQEKELDTRERSRKTQEEEVQALATTSAKVKDRINRDTAAIDALFSKTRSSQEYLTDELQRDRDDLVLALTSASGYSVENDPVIRGMQALLDLYDQAIAKRKDLEGSQALVKQAKEQERINAENDKRIQKDADSINDALKDAIKNGATGESLWENLRQTFQNRTIDIVINPVTSILSRVLAQIADEFSRMLTTSLNLSIANRSSDPLGTLISLAGWLNPSGSASTGSSLYSLGGSAIKLGGTPLAEGMSYVPYDGFPATLHRGERVLTAKENSEFSGPPISVTNSPVINIDSRADQAFIVQAVVRGMEESQRSMWAQMKARGMA